MSETASAQGGSAGEAVVRSALWAAWGDALGFPAELADETTRLRRLNGQPEGSTSSWRRRVGGRSGPMVKLPAGCISDDTQLRLAVGRCVRASGRFDAEAFSKIELPVFLSYEFGAGRATKAAAHALGRRTTRWFANFYEARGVNYLDAGGNGAAMRVQPHVWAASDGRPERYLTPVLQDAICTHGHARALLGAALHAVALGTTLRQREIPQPERWAGMVSFLQRLTSLVTEDETLKQRWLPVWENNARTSFDVAVACALEELSEQMCAAARAAERAAPAQREESYHELARDLGALNRETRGAGSLTAVLSLWIAWAYQAEPQIGLAVCSRLVGSDTDTIATLAGALLGAIAGEEPPGPLLDAELIATEANRLHTLSAGARLESFPHPDPLHWQPPASLSDAVGLIDGRIAVAGLGLAEESSEIIRGHGKEPGLWQWLTTEYGQRLLIKRRANLTELPHSAHPRPRAPVTTEIVKAAEQSRLFTSDVAVGSFPDDPEEGVALLVARRYDRVFMSQLLEHYARRGSIQAAVFAALLSERLRERELGTSSGNGGPAEPGPPSHKSDGRR